jgi:hypothetical protein
VLSLIRGLLMMISANHTRACPQGPDGPELTCKRPLGMQHASSNTPSQNSCRSRIGRDYSALVKDLHALIQCPVLCPSIPTLFPLSCILLRSDLDFCASSIHDQDTERIRGCLVGKIFSETLLY